MVSTLDRVETAEERDQHVLDELLAEISEKLHAGQVIDLEEYTTQFPQLAGRIQRLLPAMQAMADLGCASHDGGHPALGRGDPAVPSPGMLGDFRILREIGRGGMGVVYEAEQISIGRHVALKVLPFAAILDPRQLNRFQNEARAAGTLDHPHIVPVYSVGTDRGVHYYAMPLIHGQSLAELIAGLRESQGLARQRPFAGESSSSHRAAGNDRHVARSAPSTDAIASATVDTQPQPPATESALSAFGTRAYFRGVAQLGIQAAQALDYAHQNGIVHRDVKPGNLLVNSEGKLWVTDFGLAHVDSEASVTMTGDIVGTLRYMSPEQTQPLPAVVDHRTDIYSLGATLYELLILQPACRATSRQALLREIAESEPISPPKINSAIPRELVTIVSKALEKRPEDRYMVAREMADDLMRFLDDRPLQARPPSTIARTTKWFRRHRTVLWFSAVSLVLTTLMLAISTALVYRAYRSEAEQRRRTEDAYAKADQRFSLARRAVDDMYFGIALQWLSSGLVLTDLQEGYLKQGLRFYEEISRPENLDALSAEERGMVFLRLFDIHHALAHWDEALSATENAAATFEAMLRDEPNNAEYLRTMAWAHNNGGCVLDRLGRIEEADRAWRKALAAYQQLAAAEPDNSDYQLGVARGYINRSGFAARFESLEDGEQLARRGLDLAQQVAKREFDMPYNQVAFVAAGQLASLLNKQGRHQEAESLLRDAVASCRGLATDDRDMRRLAGRLCNAWGNSLAKLGRFDEAETTYRLGLKCLEESLRYGRSPANIINDFRTAPVPSAVLDYVEPDTFNCHAEIQLQLGQLLADQGRRDEALPLFEESRGVLAPLLVVCPGTLDYMDNAATSEQKLASLLMDREPDPARQHLCEAVKIRRAMMEIAPRHVDYRAALGDSLGQLALLSAAQGEFGEARSQLEDAMGQDEMALDEHPGYAEARDHLAQHLNQMASILVTAEPDVYRDPTRAVKLVNRALELNPERVEAWQTLGIAQHRRSDWQASNDSLEKSMELRSGGDSVDFFFLAMNYWQLGQVDEARRWYRRAVEWMDQNQSDDNRLCRLRAEAEEVLFTAVKDDA